MITKDKVSKHQLTSHRAAIMSDESQNNTKKKPNITSLKCYEAMWLIKGHREEKYGGPTHSAYLYWSPIYLEF